MHVTSQHHLSNTGARQTQKKPVDDGVETETKKKTRNEDILNTEKSTDPSGRKKICKIISKVLETNDVIQMSKWQYNFPIISYHC